MKCVAALTEANEHVHCCERPHCLGICGRDPNCRRQCRKSHTHTVLYCDVFCMHSFIYHNSKPCSFDSFDPYWWRVSILTAEDSAIIYIAILYTAIYFKYMFTYLCIYRCIYIRTHIYIYIYMCTHVCVFTHTHIHVYTHTHIHTHMYINKHTYIQLCK